jgi:hypothetical protein
MRGGRSVVRDRWCDASWPAATSPGAGADRICLEIRFSCIGLTSGTGACPRGALRRTGSVLLLCSGIAVDKPARKADTAKAANVVFRFMRTNCLGNHFRYGRTTDHFLADFMAWCFAMRSRFPAKKGHPRCVWLTRRRVCCYVKRSSIRAGDNTQ